MNALLSLSALVAAPFFLGLVNQTKAFFAGRRGPGLFRLYFDLLKLMRKSCPRATTTTWLFDLAPSVALAATLLAAALFPWSRSGDAAPRIATCSAVACCYLLGTGRFFTVLGAPATLGELGIPESAIDKLPEITDMSCWAYKEMTREDVKNILNMCV